MEQMKKRMDKEERERRVGTLEDPQECVENRSLGEISILQA